MSHLSFYRFSNVFAIFLSPPRLLFSHLVQQTIFVFHQPIPTILPFIVLRYIHNDLVNLFFRPNFATPIFRPRERVLSSLREYWSQGDCPWSILPGTGVHSGLQGKWITRNHSYSNNLQFTTAVPHNLYTLTPAAPIYIYNLAGGCLFPIPKWRMKGMERIPSSKKKRDLRVTGTDPERVYPLPGIWS